MFFFSIIKLNFNLIIKKEYCFALSVYKKKVVSWNNTRNSLTYTAGITADKAAKTDLEMGLPSINKTMSTPSEPENTITN